MFLQQDINMAERVHALLMKGDNYKLVGDAYKESIYYRHLVTVACRFVKNKIFVTFE